MKHLTFQLATPAVEARLRLPNQKHTFRDAAAQVGFFIPFESSIRPGPTCSHQTRCRVCKKHTRLRCDNCGKGVCRNIEKFLNLANVVCVSEYIGGYVYDWFFR